MSLQEHTSYPRNGDWIVSPPLPAVKILYDFNIFCEVFNTFLFIFYYYYYYYYYWYWITVKSHLTLINFVCPWTYVIGLWDSLNTLHTLEANWITVLVCPQWAFDLTQLRYSSLQLLPYLQEVTACFIHSHIHAFPLIRLRITGVGAGPYPSC